MTDRMREAAKRRQQNIDAAKAAAEAIAREREERLARERTIPKTTARPLDEEPATTEEISP